MKLFTLELFIKQNFTQQEAFYETLEKHGGSAALTGTERLAGDLTPRYIPSTRHEPIRYVLPHLNDHNLTFLDEDPVATFFQFHAIVINECMCVCVMYEINCNCRKSTFTSITLNKMECRNNTT